MKSTNKKLFFFISEHWVLVSSLFLLISATIGFFYSSLFFSQFGLSYFHFADFSDLWELLFVSYNFITSLLLFVIVIFIFYSISESDETKQPVEKLKLYRKNKIMTYISKPLEWLIFMLLGLFILFILIQPFKVPIDNANKIKSGHTEFYSIKYGKNKNSLDCINLVGSSSSNLIFWDRGNLETVIINRASIIELRVLVSGPPQINTIQLINDQLDNFNKWKEIVNKKCPLINF